MLKIRTIDGAIMAIMNDKPTPVIVKPTSSSPFMKVSVNYDRALLCYTEPHIIPQDVEIYPISPRIVYEEYDNSKAYRPGSVPEWCIIQRLTRRKLRIWDAVIHCPDMDHNEGTEYNYLISAIIRGKDMVRLLTPPDSLVSIYDNRGESTDRYTLMYKKRVGLRLSWNPDDPRGVSIDIKKVPDPIPKDYGVEVSWLDLPKRVREYVLRRGNR